MAKRGFESLLDVELQVAGGDKLAASSHILAAASPVFASMLTNGMAESSNKKVKLEEKSREAMEDFLRIIHPFSGRRVRITVENIDHLLPLLDEYQIDGYKDECENTLVECPATVHRVMMARRYGLDKAYGKLLPELARRFLDEDIDLCEMVAMPEVLRDLMGEVKKCFVTKPRAALHIKVLADNVHSAIPAESVVRNRGTHLAGPYSAALKDGARLDTAVKAAILKLADTF